MEPQTIIDQPIPLLEGSTTPSTGNNTDPVTADSGASVPTTHIDVAFPPVIVAQETIAQSLNTETKAILAQYTFESLGAIVIGGFSQGVSGEVKISPNGIVAKNVNGDTTFALDGTTGNASFLGIVEATDFLISGGTVIVRLIAGQRHQGFTDIQSAINFANSNGGGEVYIPAGTYTFNANINLYSNIYLIGADPNNTIIDFNSTASQILVDGSVTPQANVRLENLTIKNSTINGTSALKFNGVSFFQVRNCVFATNDHGGGNGGDISVISSSLGLIELCTSTSSNRLCIINLSNNIRVLNNNITTNTGDGIFTASSTEVLIQGNVFDNSKLISNSDYTKIIGNSFKNMTTDPIYVTAANYNIIANNSISFTSGTHNAIRIVGESNEVLGNIIIGAWSIGVWLDDGNYNIVAHNRISASTTGIVIDASCDRSLITSNRWTGSGAITNNGSNTTQGNNIS